MEFYEALQQYREPWTIKTVNIDINIGDVGTLYVSFDIFVSRCSVCLIFFLCAEVIF
jgi:hypothetical protein